MLVGAHGLFGPIGPSLREGGLTGRRAVALASASLRNIRPTQSLNKLQRHLHKWFIWHCPIALKQPTGGSATKMLGPQRPPQLRRSEEAQN